MREQYSDLLYLCKGFGYFARSGSRTLVVMSTTTDTELPSDWWSTADVLAYLKSVGTPISRATWSAYVSRGQAPAPDRTFGKSPVWRPKAVKDWQASRPRRGSASE